MWHCVFEDVRQSHSTMGRGRTRVGVLVESVPVKGERRVEVLYELSPNPTAGFF